MATFAYLTNLITAIYARYSSESQNPTSCESQIAECRRAAQKWGLKIAEAHIYTDEAKTGSIMNRHGLESLMAAAEQGLFQVVLVDDFSRLNRNLHDMLTVIAQLRFYGIRVISVSEGLDSFDEDNITAIQFRGIFNEHYLSDLKKKTFRGQRYQKEKGYSVGESTFGYRSVPEGPMRQDKNGQMRPEGYKPRVEPAEAQTILRAFCEIDAGKSLVAIVKLFNQEKIPGRKGKTQKWSVSTINRLLGNPKYIGRWIWNQYGSRRDPKTMRRRKFLKPEQEWIIIRDESLRIVPQDLWDRVQKRRKEIAKVFPGGKGKRGFPVSQGGSWVSVYPNHLLAGNLICGVCNFAIGQVGGKGGGYYGCFQARYKKCTNHILVRRKLAETLILNALKNKISDPDSITYILRQVEEEIRRMSSHLPETVQLKQAELDHEQRKIDNFVMFISQGNGSEAIARALSEAEQRKRSIEIDLQIMKQASANEFKRPPAEWVVDRIRNLGELLELRTPASALALRKILGPIVLVPKQGDIGKPYYEAKSNIGVLDLLTAGDNRGAQGSSSLNWWAV